MSALNPSAIRFASNGNVYVAPVGTAAPVDVATPLAVTWKSLGYIDPTGVECTPSVETQPVEAWQSGVPIKYLVVSAAFALKFVLQQFDKETTELYFGASFVPAMTTADPPVAITGVFKLDLSSSPSMVETAVVLEWNDATVKNRLIIPRATVNARDGLKLLRTANQQLGVTMGALDSNGSLGTLLTNAAVGA